MHVSKLPKAEEKTFGKDEMVQCPFPTDWKITSFKKSSARVLKKVFPQ